MCLFSIEKLHVLINLKKIDLSKKTVLVCSCDSSHAMVKNLVVISIFLSAAILEENFVRRKKT